MIVILAIKKNIQKENNGTNIPGSGDLPLDTPVKNINITLTNDTPVAIKQKSKNECFGPQFLLLRGSIK